MGVVVLRIENKLASGGGDEKGWVDGGGRIGRRDGTIVKGSNVF